MYSLAGAQRPGSYKHYLIWTNKFWKTSFILEGQDLEDFWDYVENNCRYKRVIQSRTDNHLTSERALKLRFVYDLRLRRNLSFDL